MKHVYGMIRSDGALKVGISGKPEVRKAALRQEFKDAVEIMFLVPKRADARAVEGIAHRLLEAKRDAGEWFFATVEEAMEAVSQAVDIVEGRIPDPTGEFSKLLNAKQCRQEIGRMVTRKNIAIPDPNIVKLERIAEKRGLTLPDIVRMAIDDYLEKHDPVEASK